MADPQADPKARREGLLAGLRAAAATGDPAGVCACVDGGARPPRPLPPRPRPPSLAPALPRASRRRRLPLTPPAGGPSFRPSLPRV